MRNFLEPDRKFYKSTISSAEEETKIYTVLSPSIATIVQYVHKARIDIERSISNTRMTRIAAFNIKRCLSHATVLLADTICLCVVVVVKNKQGKEDAAFNIERCL